MTTAQHNEGARERWLFLGSSLVLLAAVLMGLAREQHWGEQLVPLHLVSSNADGLRVGQEVRISGMPVGKVLRLQLMPDASVSVQLQVEKRYASLIGPRSRARQGQEGFVGDHYLAISPDPDAGTRATRLRDQSILYEQPIEVATLMKQLVATQEELQATLRNSHRLTAEDLPQTLREARQSLISVNTLARTLQQESTATAPDLRQALQQLSRTGSSAEKASIEAQQLLRDSQPVLLRTLDELGKTSHTSRRLLESLLGQTSP